MHLAYASILAPDARNLRGREKPHALVSIQTIVLRNKMFLQMGKPLRMGEIARAEEINPLLLRPLNERGQLHLGTRGATESGMDVKIANESHHQ